MYGIHVMASISQLSLERPCHIFNSPRPSPLEQRWTPKPRRYRSATSAWSSYQCQASQGKHSGCAVRITRDVRVFFEPRHPVCRVGQNVEMPMLKLPQPGDLWLTSDATLCVTWKSDIWSCEMGGQRMLSGWKGKTHQQLLETWSCTMKNVQYWRLVSLRTIPLQLTPCDSFSRACSIASHV